MTSVRARTWLRDGRLFISSGFIDDESGQRYLIEAGELVLRDGYLCVLEVEPVYQGPERRRGGVQRRRIERRRLPVLRLPPREEEAVT